MPKVSIIIPVYNVEQYLKECLESCINQTFKDIEIICINDGSTDNSLEILNEYKSKDERITVINQENHGVSSARNLGMSIAQGDYYMFVDSDDWLDKSAIEQMYNKITEDESDLLIAKYYDCYGLKKIEYKFPCYIANAEPFYFYNCHNDFFYSNTGTFLKLYKNNEHKVFFPLNMSLGEDSVFYWLYCLSYNPKISILNKPLYYYRQNPDSAMHNTKLVLENKLIDSAEYLINSECFGNAPKYFQTHILDRFLMSICYQIDVTLENTYIPKTYYKRIDKFINKYLKYDKSIIQTLRYYKQLKRKIKKFKIRPLKNLIQTIFSIKEEGFYKVITIMGVNIKIKTKFDQPVDMVYLWCDGNDEEFKKQKNDCLKKLGFDIPKEATNSCRYVDNEELKYSLRSLEKFANWINNIYIVTNGQCPKWLNLENKRIKLVTHEQIMPEEALPNFNSSAIEICIDNIPNLNNYFLYGNDDCLFFNEVTPDFFFKNRKPIYRYSHRYIPKSSMYTNLLENAEKLIYKKYRKKYNRYPHHNIDPFVKSDMKGCKKIFEEEINKTISTHFREDKNITKTIYSNYALATGKGIFKKLSWYKTRDSIDVGANDKEILWKIFRYQPKLLCINDNESTTNEDRLKVKQIFELLFPEKSEFEK